MGTKKMVAFRLDKAVVELLKKIAAEQGVSQASLIRKLILNEAYK
jgi:predicted DNA-binding ribbon-helix-helix protein